MSTLNRTQPQDRTPYQPTLRDMLRLEVPFEVNLGEELELE